MNDQDPKHGDYASPPCYAHELDELYRDLVAPDRETRRDVMRWRKAERESLRARRNALDTNQRAAASRRRGLRLHPDRHHLPAAP